YLAKAGKSGQNMDLALIEAFFRDRLQNLLAAAPKFRQIQFALGFTQLAIAPLFNAIGQISSDLFLEPAQHEGAQFRGKPSPGNTLRVLRVFTAWLIVLKKMLLA